MQTAVWILERELFSLYTSVPRIFVYIFFLRGIMKKYVMVGLALGITVSALIVFLRRRRLAGTEFRGFFDSSTVAEDVFGDAFDEFPDKP
jgi:hypothetical protein